MKYAILEYGASNNFGDEVQMIAAAQFMPKDYLYIPRESFKNASKQKCLTLMNGYYSSFNNPGFPPDKSIIPVYTSMHIADPKKFLTPQAIAHLQKHAPIGCRDKATYEALRQCNIEAFESKCLSLTFSKREKAPKNGRPLLVSHSFSGMDTLGEIEKVLPKEIRKKLIWFAHSHHLDSIGTTRKLNIANGLLSYYRQNASLIVTNLVHCALPCVAMGIPVVFVDEKNDPRTHIVEDIGLTRHKLKITKTVFGKYIQRRKFAEIDYDPKPLQIENIKTEIIKSTQKMIQNTLERNKQKASVPKFTPFDKWQKI